MPRSGTSSWSLGRIIRATFPLLVVLSGLEMGSGVVLEGVRESYVDNPSLLILVPVMIGMGGNLGSILSSRLSTGLHLGTAEIHLRDSYVMANILGVFGLAATVFVALGFSAYVLSRTVLDSGSLSLVTVLTVSVVSGMVLTVVVVGVSLSVTYLAYTWGIDPDDVAIPVVTNVCDILGVVILSVVVVVVV